MRKETGQCDVCLKHFEGLALKKLDVVRLVAWPSNAIVINDVCADCRNVIQNDFISRLKYFKATRRGENREKRSM